MYVFLPFLILLAPELIYWRVSLQTTFADVDVPFGDDDENSTTTIDTSSDATTNAVSTESDENVTAATVSEFPFMASVQIRSKHICGGSLYTPRLVLTAAHCCFRLPVTEDDKLRPNRRYKTKEMSVLMGTNCRLYGCWETEYQRRGVLFSFTHDAYKPYGGGNSIYHDLALLMLSHAMVLSNVVQLVPLKTPDEPVTPPGTPCVTVGWGVMSRIDEEGCFLDRRPAVVQMMKVPVTILAECKESPHLSELPTPPYHLCASWRGQQICMGDSGSPFLCNGKQIGLVGRGCSMQCPGYYTRLDTEHEAVWLDDAVKRCEEGTAFQAVRGEYLLVVFGLILSLH